MENIAHEDREKLSSFDYREGIDSPFVVADFFVTKPVLYRTQILSLP